MTLLRQQGRAWGGHGGCCCGDAHPSCSAPECVPTHCLGSRCAHESRPGEVYSKCRLISRRIGGSSCCVLLGIKRGATVHICTYVYTYMHRPDGGPRSCTRPPTWHRLPAGAPRELGEAQQARAREPQRRGPRACLRAMYVYGMAAGAGPLPRQPRGPIGVHTGHACWLATTCLLPVSAQCSPRHWTAQVSVAPTSTATKCCSKPTFWGQRLAPSTCHSRQGTANVLLGWWFAARELPGSVLLPPFSLCLDPFSR